MRDVMYKKQASYCFYSKTHFSGALTYYLSLQPSLIPLSLSDSNWVACYRPVLPQNVAGLHTECIDKDLCPENPSSALQSPRFRLDRKL